MYDQEIEKWRGQLDRLTGRARLRPLLELGQRLAMRYWQTGPGTTAGLPDLDEAIRVMTEAVGYLEPGDFLHTQAVAQLGTLVGGRVVAYEADPARREEAIRMLRDGLGAGVLPPVQRDTCRLVLGQLYMTRVTRALQTPDVAVTAARTGAGLPGREDLDLAAACFRQVVDGPAANAEIGHMAETLSSAVESMRTMLSTMTGPGGADFGPMITAMRGMRDLQQRMRDRAAPGGNTPPMPAYLDADRIVGGDAIDYPVAVVPGPEPAPAAPVTPVVPRPRPEATPDLDSLRRRVHDRLVRGADLYVALAARLLPDAPLPDAAAVDELVALTTSVVHGGGDRVGDHLLIAFALHQRSLIDDGGGWDDDDPRVAGEHLLAIADGLVTQPAAVASVAVTLAGLLDGRYPDGQLLPALAERFAVVRMAAREVGARAFALPRPGGVTLLDVSAGHFTSVTYGSPLPHWIVVAGNRALPVGSGVVSYVSTAAQLVTLAGRARAELSAAPVFVGDDAAAVCTTFYRDAKILTNLPDRWDASLLYIGTEIAPAAGAVRGGTRRGGLAVLARSGPNFVALADALLDDGCTGVIGWTRTVPPHIADAALFALHHRLLVDGLDPATAVREVRCWMRDPGRSPVPGMPATLTALDTVPWDCLMLRGI